MDNSMAGKSIIGFSRDSHVKPIARPLKNLMPTKISLAKNEHRRFQRKQTTQKTSEPVALAIGKK